MSFEINGQKFESIEDYEENYVVCDMTGDETKRWYEMNEKPTKTKGRTQASQFTNEEVRLYMGMAMKSAFLALAIMGGTILGFIAFCLFIWL